MPLIIILGFLVIDDPFSVFYKTNGIAEKSTDIVITKKFMQNADTAHYNTFVFGNSRMNSFEAGYLKNCFGKTNKVFYFNSPGEAILNMYKKINIIKKYDCHIENALLLIDESIVKNTNNRSDLFKGPVYIHSVHTSNIGYFDFYKKYIVDYFTNFFFAKHIYYTITKTYKPWMKDCFPDPGNKQKTPSALNLKDSLLMNDFNEFKKMYKPHYNRVLNEKLNITQIDSTDVFYLREIRNVFVAEKTNYYIIIPPGFHQKKFNGTSLNQLKQIFGSRVYDFSGINAITSDSTLNYEQTHFSKQAGQMMMDSIFLKKHLVKNN